MMRREERTHQTMHRALILVVLAISLGSIPTSARASTSVAALGVQLRDLRAGYGVQSASYSASAAAGVVGTWGAQPRACTGCVAGYTVHYVRHAHSGMWDP